MRLSCMHAMVPGDTLTEKARNLSRWGFHAIEVALEASSDLEMRLRELECLPASTGIGVSLLVVRRPASAAGQPAHAGEVTRQTTSLTPSRLEVLKMSIDASSRLGVPTMTSFEYRPRSVLPWSDPYAPMPADVRAQFLDMLGTLADVAEARGGMLLLEPVNRYESSHVNTVAEAVSLVKEVGSPHLGVLVDFFHMAIEEASIPGAILAGRGFIKHVHLGDSNRLLPGRGHTDFGAGFRALKQIAFEGYLSLECCVGGPPEVELPRCACRLASCWDTCPP